MNLTQFSLAFALNVLQATDTISNLWIRIAGCVSYFIRAATDMLWRSRRAHEDVAIKTIGLNETLCSQGLSQILLYILGLCLDLSPGAGQPQIP